MFRPALSFNHLKQNYLGSLIQAKMLHLLSLQLL